MRNLLLAVLIFLNLLLILIKLKYEYYHFLAPVLLIFLMWKLEVSGRKKRIRKKVGITLVGITLIGINLLILLIPDQFVYRLINNDQYYWSEKALDRKHFKGSLEEDSEFTASVFPGMSGNISRVYNYPNVIIHAVDDNNDSWIKAWKFRNDEMGKAALQRLLIHEKKHLDITEIYRRKALNSINSLWFPSYESKYGIISYFFKVSDSTNDVFDKETGHGIKVPQRDIWNERIRSQLKDR